MRLGALAQSRFGGIPALLTVGSLILALMSPAVALAQTGDKLPLGGGSSQSGGGDSSALPADWFAAGLISESAYQSPRYGYSVEWSEDWALDLEALDEDGNPLPVTSDDATGVDTLYLAWSGERSAPVFATILGQVENRGGLRREIADWTNEEWIAQQWSSDVEAIVLTSSRDQTTASVLYRLDVVLDTGPSVYYIFYRAIYADDYTIYLTFTAEENYFEDAYVSLDGLLIDGEPFFVFADWADIQDAIDSAP